MFVCISRHTYLLRAADGVMFRAYRAGQLTVMTGVVVMVSGDGGSSGNGDDDVVMTGVLVRVSGDVLMK